MHWRVDPGRRTKRTSPVRFDARHGSDGESVEAEAEADLEAFLTER